MSEFTPEEYKDDAPDMGELVRAELGRGERLIWSGQPSPFAAMLKGCLVFLFAIPWTAFSIFWTVMAYQGVEEMAKNGDALSYAFPLFGVPFILIGLALLSTPFLEYFKAKKRVYAITDRRALTIEGGRSKKVITYPFSDWKGEVFRRESKDGSGSLSFAAQIMVSSKGNRTIKKSGFFGIKNVRRVDETLRRALRDYKAKQEAGLLEN